MVKTRIAVLISGGGTNLQALIDAEKKGIISSGRLEIVISSNENAYGLVRAREADIKSFSVNRKKMDSQESFEKEMIRILRENEIDMIVLAGFMQILSADFTDKYKGRIINVHPSLIPSFCGEGCYGLRVHKMALEKGVKVTGATVHFVNEVADGGRIILQKAVEVRKGDTPKTLQRRVMEEAEWKILPKACEMVSSKIAKEKETMANDHRVYEIPDVLADNTYPGRGIIIGKSPDGRAVSAYFIMGRSENSRNRIFELKEGELFTRPFDPSKVEDPSLIIYAALRCHDDKLVVTNGDQTDTVIDFLKAGKTFEEALKTREFEPDHPNLTPRISAMIDFGEDGDEFSYKISILKSEDEEGRGCSRYTFDYEPREAVGHLIHTYQCDGMPLPSFEGEPVRVSISDDIDGFTETLWSSLDIDNRISLYVRFTDPKSGESEERLINKNEERN